MNLTDTITLRRLARKYGVEADLAQVLEAAGRIAPADMQTLSANAARLPEETLLGAIEHPDFPTALRRLFQVADGPPRRTLAFLKLGVPVRGLVLPKLLRDRLPADVAIQGGRLMVEGQAVDLGPLTFAQHQALQAVAAGGRAG